MKNESTFLPSGGGKKLEVDCGGYSCAGGKARNEDAFAVHRPSTGGGLIRGVTACIADGAGCSDNAQLASRTSVEHFIADFYSTPDTWPVKTAAARVLSALNAWLHHHGRQTTTHNALVTTFSAVVLKSTTAHVFHVGDSRVYRYRDGQLDQLTRDHRLQQRDSALLTRALGMDNRVEVDYVTEPLQVGDILVLTTDGVHDFLSRTEIATLLRNLDDGNLEETARNLVAAALYRGGDDNASCLLLRIVNLPLEEIDEIHRRLTSLVIPPVLQAGQVIDGLTVLRVLQSGTRSYLYLVRGPDEIDYVLKAPSENFAQDAVYLEGFMREQWIGLRLDHAAVMKVYPRPENSPFLYLLCEYIDGKTLRQWLFDNPRPSLESVRHLTREVVGALRAFQRLHMVHRDLKPENVMVMDSGAVKIIDFGTVHVGGLSEMDSPLCESTPVGAVDYCAPECLPEGGGTHASDIFSLGVMVYEMLTGKLPFSILAKRRQRHYGLREYRYVAARDIRTDLPVWVDLALAKATHPNPAQRYQALSEFMGDICVPNEEMLARHRSASLLERDPLNFWRGLALLLLATVIVQTVFLLAR